MRETREYERFHSRSPCRQYTGQPTKWMVRTLQCVLQHRDAFRHMAASWMRPPFLRPSLRLKSRVQLADVVQKYQHPQPCDCCRSERTSERTLGAVPERRQIQQALEDRRHIHTVVRQMMVGSIHAIEFSPCGLSHLIFLMWWCFRHKAIALTAQDMVSVLAIRLFGSIRNSSQVRRAGQRFEALACCP